MPETERPQNRKQPPPPVSAERLERVALRYLERFSASAASLGRVLARRVERSARDHGTDPAEGARWIQALIERYLRSGLLDDAVYAEAKAGSLRRRGASARAIRGTLAAKGVDAETAAAALARADQDGGAPDTDPDTGYGAPDGAEEDAARAFAKRRRLGPFRPAARRAEQRNRDLAALGRAGFSYEIARRVIDAESEGADEL